MKAHIIAEKDRVSDIVRQMTEEVFNTMFGKALTAGSKNTVPKLNEVIISQVRLNHGTTDINFYFKFDMQMMLQIASKVFSQDYIEQNPIHEDLACEVANIVCHKVKAYLNEEGFHTEMSFPFVPKAEEDKMPDNPDYVNIYFFYLDQDSTHRLGVAVGSTVI